jgi:acyl-CoA synthetase (AMP-forming)/AMP-acid ligase II
VSCHIASTLVGVLSQHALDRPTAEAFSFLARGETETETRSFADLDRRSRAIASWLSHEGLSGKLVLLLLADNAAFIDALMGCFYAGVIAVPAVVPRANRPTTSIEAIARDAGVAAVLTARRELAYLKPALSEALPNAGWYCLEDVDGDPSTWSGRQISTKDLAFLQYTSGSTGTPKGVMVTHGNLMANEAAIQRSMGLSSETIFVGWLPLFHDMGLIGNVLQPLYLGVPCVLMPTTAFLQRPLRWLKAISAYGGTISGAPNFAYDLCVDRIPPAPSRSALLPSSASARRLPSPDSSANPSTPATAWRRQRCWRQAWRRLRSRRRCRSTALRSAAARRARRPMIPRRCNW